MDRFLEMQTFTRVVDAGSFVGAAESLGLSKAAISRHVNELESRLGVRLLHRTTRRLSLTSEGEVFLARCRELLAGLEEAEAEVTSSRDTARGLLRVNAPVTYGVRHLAPLWGGFRERHPLVGLDITLSDRVVDLLEEGFDLAIRIGRLSSSSLVARQLSQTRLRLCAAPQYLADHGVPDHPQDLAEHAVIAYSYWSGGDEWIFEGPEGEVGVRVAPWLHSNNGDTCREAALAGQGIIVQPDFLVGEDIASGALVELMPGYRAAELGIYAVYPTRRHVASKVQVLIQYLREQLAGAAP